jgi:hypothetical protein
VNQLACEELAGGLDAFGRKDMTEPRIEFRLDLETSSTEPSYATRVSGASSAFTAVGLPMPC